MRSYLIKIVDEHGKYLVTQGQFAHCCDAVVQAIQTCPNARRISVKRIGGQAKVVQS